MHLTTRVSERRLLRIRDRAHASSKKGMPARVQAGLEEPAKRAAAPEAAGDGGVNPERRRFSRVPLNSKVVIRRITGFNFQVAVRDVSSGGCRVELLEPCEVGDPMITRFPELEPLGSRACWTQGTTTGVQFLTAIHSAVFESLLARLPDAETSAA
jgi:hypothetical protein